MTRSAKIASAPCRPALRSLGALGALLTLLAANPARAISEQLHDWATIHNARFGFSIAYPSQVFAPKANPHNDEGRVMVSADSHAKLLVGAFPNAAKVSLTGYKAFILAENFPGAKLDYERTSDTWFVISGIHKGQMFYQRVSFTCGGKLISSWAMVYPVTERALYDRVVEGVARTFTPGAGANGTCD